MQTPEDPNQSNDSNEEEDSQLTEITNVVDAEAPTGNMSSSGESQSRKRYGRYTIQQNLGAGGFGRVYLAEDDDLKRLVALKIPRLSRTAYPAILDLYKREAQTVAALDLPGVVPVYDIGVVPDGTIYIVSKYIKGSDLYGLMDRGSLNREKSVRLCIAVAETLHQVHLKSIVHRDIKPGNILVDESGEAFVSDFGLALRPTEYGKTKGKTGTLRYMSPEQVRGESHLVDGRSDLFSLGVIMYELLTGQRPFDGPDSETVQHCIQFIEPRPLRQIDDSIHPELERICLKVLAKKASDRYTTGQDFGNDLRDWIESRKSGSVSQSPVHEFVNVVPRGLRAFRGRDSAFFLSLLPGPRDRDGLPDIVRHWKLWIQEQSTEAEYRVGAIYGPSGCGKSSMLQAGILPLLDKEIDVATIQATGDSFESHLRRALIRHSRPDDDSKDQNEASISDLIARRRVNASKSEKPLLLVIDQFENWLLNCSTPQANEFAMAMRQCDGVTTKVLLMVRDDFWVALGRFMSVVDVPLIPDTNCSLVDLFDPPHAKKVLESFGRAHGRLPSGELIEPSHLLFLDRAVEDLTRAGKVYPVQLALFAEMLKGRPWVPDTLEQLGGVQGIGTQFLEETFEAEHAPVKRRMHEVAARKVLASLLPDASTDVRTKFRTKDELLATSGYEDNESAFRDLILILDTELRLISPTERADSTASGSVGMGPGSDSQDSYVSQEVGRYQLSHDFLIPSLREWVSRKQLETYQGRVVAQFNDISTLWSAKQARRFLPNWFEWLKFSIVVPSKEMSSEQHQMMKFANRRHLTSTLVALGCIFLSIWGFRSWQSKQATDALVSQLRSARFTEIENIASEFRSIGQIATQPLLDIAGDTDLPVQRRLAAQLVLFQWEPSNFEKIISTTISTPVCPPDQVAAIGNCLRDTLQSLSSEESTQESKEGIKMLWDTLEDPNASDNQRLAACHLLLNLQQYTAEQYISRREATKSDLGRILINYAAYHPSHFSLLAKDFRPAMSDLVDPLSASIGKAEPSLESSTAINFLLEFYEDDPKRLADLALDSSPWQLALFVPVIDRHGEAVLRHLREIVDPHVQRNTQARNISGREAIRVATAGALLARMSVSEPGIWNLLRFDPYPTMRSTLIHRFADVGVPRERLMQRLVDEQQDSIFAALMLALGQYPAPSYSDLADQSKKKILQAAVGARETGTMSSANWLARVWGIDNQLANQLSSPSDGSPASPNWDVTSVGIVMARIDAIKEPDIRRVFEIATTEVSVKQFLQFNEYAYYAKSVSATEDCPINIIRWQHALKFCRWLSEEEGIEEDQMCYPPVEEIDADFIPDEDHYDRTGYRLPTVAEWALACRAQTVGQQFFGENRQLAKYYAVFNETNTANPCGSMKPNDGGMFDMLGNIMEWTGDIDDDNMRKLVGGSYGLLGEDLTVGFRRSAVPETQFNSIGFRVVRTLEKAKAP
ncbi:MAG: protein kinase [Rubripirellula sp.]